MEALYSRECLSPQCFQVREHLVAFPVHHMQDVRLTVADFVLKGRRDLYFIALADAATLPPFEYNPENQPVPVPVQAPKIDVAGQQARYNYDRLREVIDFFESERTICPATTQTSRDPAADQGHAH